MPFVRLDSVKESIYWTFRSWKEGYRLPTTEKAWTPAYDPDQLMDDANNTERLWMFLADFFASRGYFLYQRTPNSFKTFPTTKEAEGEDQYPFGRRFYFDSRIDACFDTIFGVRNWAARDRLGREVIIRMASASDSSPSELEIFRRLNSPHARADPRNHTLPVLDFIVYDGLTFVVLPRWGLPLAEWHFGTVEQVLHFVKSMFEGIAFLHENRIAHRDILEQNMVANTVVNSLNCSWIDVNKLYEVAVVRYGFIDFGASAIFPLDTDIESEKVLIPRFMAAGVAYIGLQDGISNPFKDDILSLANILERLSRHIEGLVPEIGPFFDFILRENRANPPPASLILERLRQIQAGLTAQQLEQAPPGLFWRKGVIVRKHSHRNFDQIPATDEDVVQ
ncbi:hypothetical protein FA15DRAFT_689498 [Coprinopsis marcescibilis]|uniref:Protein kinase domain-containing protein n=1 Tax=Coprinopsis marcescibilis TaxID=230819 RepID=A0A5C3KHV0_COPMA|nr:hypothetical protein FA15DRAFT_689498 [Coprinopsis marcescibilis]